MKKVLPPSPGPPSSLPKLFILENTETGRPGNVKRSRGKTPLPNAALLIPPSVFQKGSLRGGKALSSKHFLKVFPENASKTVLPMPFRESSPNCVIQTLFRCTFSEKIPRTMFQGAFPMRFLETRPQKNDRKISFINFPQKAFAQVSPKALSPDSFLESLS